MAEATSVDLVDAIVTLAITVAQVYNILLTELVVVGLILLRKDGSEQRLEAFMVPSNLPSCAPTLGTASELDDREVGSVSQRSASKIDFSSAGPPK